MTITIDHSILIRAYCIIQILYFMIVITMTSPIDLRFSLVSHFHMHMGLQAI